jgi:hypothetical protein
MTVRPLQIAEAQVGLRHPCPGDPEKPPASVDAGDAVGTHAQQGGYCSAFS